jgi:large subunit ribosomal protein L21
MLAVVRTGGKQYRVSPGDVILVEKLLGNSGDTITLSDVLMVIDGDKTIVEASQLTGAAVHATIREQTRADKIIVFKKRRRQGYRRKKGHRQNLTVLTIDHIVLDGSTPVTKATQKKESSSTPEKTERAKAADTVADTVHGNKRQAAIKSEEGNKTPFPGKKGKVKADEPQEIEPQKKTGRSASAKREEQRAASSQKKNDATSQSKKTTVKTQKQSKES